ncbi:MAG: hypothetical protein MZV63_43315 [Marinilabiliales bacterium]|nr:hypothetical protein [Marinilabiliales bacterium]
MPLSESMRPNHGPRLNPTGTVPASSMITSIPHFLNSEAHHSAAFS